ncbi:MaoC family dehydratase N-terminal domain-containing protein [Pseudomonas gingeri]|uniref:MaoC family dehydratase N-terminal domain-containing protein n=1 Tax=Pseudomonas gingeri TaxID=117681 RepID=A0A7Y7XHL4_9PSED|nr:MaoC family dehydratase N-terminal domain-containing protein [Pseudomonas gingeri]NWB99790.1 MaoC family dehydratase N-terminal domain-containing protein [Pseudomonas gingeri]
MSGLDFSKWLGRQTESVDMLSATLLSRIAATFNEKPPANGEAIPLLWHWCFFQDPVIQSELGEDGHPAGSGFLPPADGRQRMWAGSRIDFSGAFVAGAEAHRRSVIAAINMKQGRGGSLLFVTVLHVYSQYGKVVLREEQDIVFREPSPPKLSSSSVPEVAHWREPIEPAPTLLFRYSAVTFNGHRIHYDWPYATQQEGYPGLVVQGPLIATLALRGFVRAQPFAKVRRFSFKGVRPLVTPTPFEVGGIIDQPGVATVWAGNGNGIGQEGRVEFE